MTKRNAHFSWWFATTEKNVKNSKSIRSSFCLENFDKITMISFISCQSIIEANSNQRENCWIDSTDADPKRIVFFLCTREDDTLSWLTIKFPLHERWPMFFSRTESNRIDSKEAMIRFRFSSVNLHRRDQTEIDKCPRKSSASPFHSVVSPDCWVDTCFAHRTC